MPRTEQQRDARNQDPHKPAQMAMYVWAKAYAAQRGGVMDFWDGLSPCRKDLCRGFVLTLEKARPETGAEKRGR